MLTMWVSDRGAAAQTHKTVFNLKSIEFMKSAQIIQNSSNISLSICKRICEVIHGSLKCQLIPNVKNTFKFEFKTELQEPNRDTMQNV